MLPRANNRVQINKKFDLEEKRGERKNGMLNNKENSSKNSRSEPRHCQRPGIILDERDSVL